MQGPLPVINQSCFRFLSSVLFWFFQVAELDLHKLFGVDNANFTEKTTGLS